MFVPATYIWAALYAWQLFAVLSLHLHHVVLLFGEGHGQMACGSVNANWGEPCEGCSLAAEPETAWWVLASWGQRGRPAGAGPSMQPAGQHTLPAHTPRCSYALSAALSTDGSHALTLAASRFPHWVCHLLNLGRPQLLRNQIHTEICLLASCSAPGEAGRHIMWLCSGLACIGLVRALHAQISRGPACLVKQWPCMPCEAEALGA